MRAQLKCFNCPSPTISEVQLSRHTCSGHCPKSPWALWFQHLPHPHFIFIVKSAPRECICEVSLLEPPPSNRDDGTWTWRRALFLDQISWGCLREVLKWCNEPVRSDKCGYSTRAGKEGWSGCNVGGMNKPQCWSELVIFEYTSIEMYSRRQGKRGW